MRSTAASRATTRRRSPSAITHAVDECDALLTSGAVSMGDYDFVKVVLERARRGRGRAAVRVDAGRDQAGQAARRSATLGGGAGVRAARQPGVVARELRAVRPARAAQARGPRRRRCRAGRRARRPHRVPRRRRRQAPPRPGAGRVEDGRYVCERAGFQASNVLSGMAAATGLALLPDGDGRRRRWPRSRCSARRPERRRTSSRAQKMLASVLTERGTTCTLRRTVAGRASRGSQREAAPRVAAQGTRGWTRLRHPERH